jgi:hypothetical protein
MCRYNADTYNDELLREHRTSCAGVIDAELRDWAMATIKEKDAAKRYVDELDESRHVFRILVELRDNVLKEWEVKSTTCAQACLHMRKRILFFTDSRFT